jgi:hypothetical protein
LKQLRTLSRQNVNTDLKKSGSEKKGYILGISAFYHDSAAALLKDGDIFAAAQEERFTRKKHDASFPPFPQKQSNIALKRQASP